MDNIDKNQSFIYPDTTMNFSDYLTFQQKVTKSLGDHRAEMMAFALLRLQIGKPEITAVLLEQVQKKIAECIRKIDIVERFKENELIIALIGVSKREEADAVAKRILQEFTKPVILNNQEVFINVRIGIGISPISKEPGKNDQPFPRARSLEVLPSSSPMERNLKKAVSNNEFRLVYQPKIDIKTNEIVGVEALLRWKTSKGDLIYPEEFIPLAEETGEIVPITEWVLRTACRQVKIWHTSGLPRLMVSVNLTARILKEKNFSHTISSLLTNSGLSHRYLGIEIPEKFLLKDINSSINFIKELKILGISIAIDNVGATQSAINYLQSFNVDCINIDKVFIQNIIKDKDNANLIKDIIATAHDLNIKVVAPGVETREQLLFLKQAGCDQCQGYYFSKPIASEDFLREYQKIKLKL